LLTEDQWNGLEKIKIFLETFKEVTTIMSGYTYPTLSTTIPLYNLLIDHLEDNIDENEYNENEDFNDDNDEKLKSLISEAVILAKIKLLKYYVKTNDTYLIATILDPRLKLQYYHDHRWEDDLINNIKQRLV